MKLLKHNEKRWMVYKGWLQAAGFVVHGEAPDCIHVGLDNGEHVLSVSLISSPTDRLVRVERIATHNLSRELAEDAYFFMFAAIDGYCRILGKPPFFLAHAERSGPLAKALLESGWNETAAFDGSRAHGPRESKSPPDTIAEEAQPTNVSNTGTTNVVPAKKVRRTAAVAKPPKKVAKKRTKPSKGATS